MHQRSLLLTLATHLPSIWSTVDRKSVQLPSWSLRPNGYGTRPSAATRARPAPRPRGPANLVTPARGGSEREHAADQGPPGQRADDPVDGDAERLLEAPDRRRGLGPEDPVHGHVVTAVPQQVLQGRDGMSVAAPLHQRPRLDLVAHRVLLGLAPDHAMA